ncbi:MAG: phosphoesterase, partial [Tardiphaga sp.]
MKKSWRATTALCVIATLAIQTTAYAAGGISDWDTRAHPNRYVAPQSSPQSSVQNLLEQIQNDTAKANKSKDPTETIKTASPIKHVIVLIGENRGVDHTFGVYKPKG